MDLVTARHYFARRPRRSNVRDDDYFPLLGGLNLVDSAFNIAPGNMIACRNYEIGPKGVGYRRVKGFTRYAGQLFNVRYSLLNYEQATALPDPYESIADTGDAIEGSVSGGWGHVLGVVEEQPITVINRMLRSRDFDENVWTRDNTTIGAFVQSPIDGTLNAVELRETSTTAEHVLRQVVTKDAAERTYWLSAYVRGRGGTSSCGLRALFSASTAQVVFDFAAQSAGAITWTGDFLGLEEYMELLADGWWRIGIKFRSSVQTSITCELLAGTAGGLLSYQGDPTRGLEIDGLQLEETTADTVAPGPFVITDDQVRGNGRGHFALLHTDDANPDLVDGENLFNRATDVPYAVANGPNTIGNAESDELHARYTAMVREVNRTNVTMPPGSGPVRGVAIYHGIAYALRDNEAGTAGRLWQAQGGYGWRQIPLGFRITFSGAAAGGLGENQTLVGRTSGATGLIRRLVYTTGDANGGSGYVLLSTITGTFQNGENLALGVSPTTTSAVLGTVTAQTLNPGGRLETRVHNFYGHKVYERLYGVDGENYAFEYQDVTIDPYGTTLEFYHQIRTGMSDDKPDHIAIWNDQLWLSFPGGSVQNSSVNEPHDWTVSLGSAEYGMGMDVSGFLEEVETLFVFGKDKIKYFTGNPSGYSLKDFPTGGGAEEWSILRLGRGIFLDDRGFTSLAATQRFGNFAANSFSAVVKPLVDELRAIGITASTVVKEKNLARFFFADGRFISISVVGDKIMGITSGDFGKVVRCVESGETPDGKELIIFGSDDGYVYRMESGPSFDGSPIEAFFRTAFHFSKSPGRKKKYRRTELQVITNGPCTLKVGVDYSFADPRVAVEKIRTIAMKGGGGIWDVDKWDEFIWGEGIVANASMKLEAEGTNIGHLISHESASEDDHEVQGILVHHSIRGRTRGTTHV